MEIVVHGTKGGYCILYATPNMPSVANDIRTGANNENILGQSIYSIAFTTEGYVFTKYCVVRDTPRNYATGTVAFSLFLPVGEKLPGKDIREILDRLLQYYSEKYIKDNNINCGEASKIIREDWSFVNDILREYASKPKYDDEKLQSGATVAAFVYYNNEDELQRYFDAPFQEEYCDYKQVFFVSKKLKDRPENPLNALRHSETDLTGKIDLNNKYYYLNNYDSNRNVFIYVNDKSCSGEKGNNSIREKDVIKIVYSKDNRYYEQIYETGKLFDARIKKYLEVSGNRINIKYAAFVPRHKTREITFEVRDRKGNPIPNAEIQISKAEAQISKAETQISKAKTQIDTQPCRKINEPIATRLFDGEKIKHYRLDDYGIATVSFDGEKIRQRWKVEARKGNNLFSNTIDVIPENQIGNVVLVIDNCKIETQAVIPEENNRKIYLYQLEINGEIYKRTSINVTFKIDDINAPLNIEVSTKEYNAYYSGNVQYCPATGKNILQIELTKQLKAPRQKKLFHTKPFHIKTFRTKPFHTKPFHTKFAIIAGLFVAAIAFGVILFFIFTNDSGKSKQFKHLTTHISRYVQDIELNIDTLNHYHKTIKWSKMQKKDEYRKILPKIETAMAIRNLINTYDFAKLKGQLYSPLQEKFKESINKIGGTLYDEVGNKLKEAVPDLKQLNLNQIADKIDSIVIEINKPSEEKQVTAKQAEKKKESQMENIPTTQPETSKSLFPAQQQPVSNDQTAEIVQYLKGNELKREKLEQYKNDVTQNETLKQSIQLCLKFWDLIKSNQMDKFVNYLKNDIRKDHYLQSSELEKFLTDICVNSEAFQKYTGITGRATIKTLSQLKEKLGIQ
jgi:hypothetical protein